MNRLALAALLAWSVTAGAAEPRLMNAEPPGCKFVQQESCKTGRRDGQLRCEKWHKAQAAKAGANVVVPVSIGGNSRMSGSVGRTGFHNERVTMTADYFTCPSE